MNEEEIKMKKLKHRIKMWKIWNKHCMNRPFYKFLVLIGLVNSPTFEIIKEYSVVKKGD